MAQRSRPRGQRIRKNLRRRLITSLLALAATTLPAWNAEARAHDHAGGLIHAGFSLDGIADLDRLIGSKRQSFISPLIRPLAAQETAAESPQVELAAETTEATLARSSAARRIEEFSRLHALLGGRSIPDTLRLAAGVAADPPRERSETAAARPVESVARSERGEASREISRSLADLSCEEPVDVVSGAGQITDSSVAAEPPRFQQVAGVGGTPLVVTLDEPYLAYDLSPEDRIAMRMYPIPGLETDYFGGRRTGVDQRWVEMVPGVAWQATVEPAEIVATAPVAEAVSRIDAGGLADSSVDEVPVAAADQGLSDADLWLAAARLALSDIRIEAASLDPIVVGQRLGVWAADGLRAVDSAVGTVVVKLAAVWPAVPAAPAEAADFRMAEATLLEPRPMESDRLAAVDVSQAAADAVDAGSDGDLADIAAGELAYRTALEVVTAQAGQEAVAEDESRGPRYAAIAAVDLPRESVEDTVVADLTADQPAGETILATGDSGPSDPVARAEAVATACDQTAAALEQMAMVLRRAGDQLVRQAKAGGSVADETLLR